MAMKRHAAAPVKVRGKKQAAALGIMLLGTATVLIGAAVINRSVPQTGREEKKTTVSFTVPPAEQKEKEKPEPKEQKRDIRRSDRPALAPLPDLGANLSSIKVEMPQYAPENIGAAADSLLGDIDEDLVMTEESVDEKPVVKRKTLQFPERAKQRDIDQGTVTVSVLVGADGRVEQMKILDADPPGVFNKTVKEYVPDWTFEPATYKGRSVQVWVTIPIEFNLN